MKTNLVKLSEDVYGKLVGDAMFYCYGTCADDAVYDIANIYQLLDGSFVAESCGIIFSVEETNWRKDQMQWKYSMKKKRGYHSRIAHEKYMAKIESININELPF